MTQRKTLVLAAMIIAGGLLFAPAVVAEDAPKDTITNTTAKERFEATAKQRAEKIKNQVEERKKELEQQVKEKRAEIKQKLTDRRKEVCEKRQININKILSNSNDQGKRHLNVFANIQTKVMDFTTDKNLTVPNYDALVADADTKKAAAEAALEVAVQTTFSCDTTDASRPGKVVSDLMHTKHDALKEYRTAIKNLIVAVKQAAGKDNNNGQE